MFITREAYKSHFSALFLQNGEAAWSATEIALQQTWFLIQFQEIGVSCNSEFALSRTVLLFDFQSVEQLILSVNDSNVRLKSVHIVTPAHVNGTNDWKMDQLRAVWNGIVSVDERETSTNIFETVSGKKYPSLFSSRSLGEFAGETLKFEFSH